MPPPTPKHYRLHLIPNLAHSTFDGTVELRLESPEELRAAALGTLYASATTAQLIGPALGAVALLPLGPFPVFVLNGLTFFGVALAVAAMKGGLHQQAATPATPEVPEESKQPAGYRWLLRYRELVSYSLVSLSLALLVQATAVIEPAGS